VILNLAIFFGYHVLWPNGIDRPFDWVSGLIAAGAVVALIRFKLNVMWVIPICAAIGLATQLHLSL